MTEATVSVDFAKIDEILDYYEHEKTNLIAILQHVQGIYHYLPEEVLTYIGEKIEGLSPATVYGVATFYSQFSLEPKGKYEIKVCDGTACHVRGSAPLLEMIKSKLKFENNKFTTDDRLFSLEIVNCLGACALAPAIVINGKVYPKMTQDAVSTIIDTLIKDERN